MLFASGALILRRDPLGYLIALPLLVFEVLLAPMIAARTVSQLEAGWSFTAGEIVGPIAGFVLLALIAIGSMVAILRNISDRVAPTVAHSGISRSSGWLRGSSDAGRV